MHILRNTDVLAQPSAKRRAGRLVSRATILALMDRKQFLSASRRTGDYLYACRCGQLLHRGTLKGMAPSPTYTWRNRWADSMVSLGHLILHFCRGGVRAWIFASWHLLHCFTFLCSYCGGMPCWWFFGTWYKRCHPHWIWLVSWVRCLNVPPIPQV